MSGFVRVLLVVNAIPLAVGMLALAIWGLGESAAVALIYQRQAILDGDWLRLVSGHWVHSSWRHLALNLAGLALIWHLVGDAVRAGSWLFLMVIIVLGQPLGLLFFYPGVLWFEGLSGLLHGLLVVGALLTLGRTKVLSGLLPGAIAIKLGQRPGKVLHREHWPGSTHPFWWNPICGAPCQGCLAVRSFFFQVTEIPPTGLRQRNPTGSLFESAPAASPKRHIGTAIKIKSGMFRVAFFPGE